MKAGIFESWKPKKFSSLFPTNDNSKSKTSSMEYKPVDADEWHDENAHSPEPEYTPVSAKQTDQKRRLQYIMMSIILAFVLMMIPTMITISLAQNTATTAERSQQGLHCGNSTAEARALGCEFDFLSYSWTPTHCLDRDTSAEFVAWAQSSERQFGAWPIFADPEGQQRIPDLKALSELAPTNAYTSQELHLAHCIFWMRYMERVSLGTVMATSRGDGLKHTVHCTKQLLERLEGYDAKYHQSPGSVFRVGFNTC